MSIPFPKDVVLRAWKRQSGKCAACCKSLAQANQDRGETGAWHAHHRKPTSDGGSQTLGNCVILCINEPDNCHFNVGHGGMSWGHYQPLGDSELPCIYIGHRTQRTITRHIATRYATNAKRKKTQKRGTKSSRKTFSTLSTFR